MSNINLRLFPNRFYQCVIALVVSCLIGGALPAALGVSIPFWYLTTTAVVFMAICVIISFAFSSRNYWTINIKGRNFRWETQVLLFGVLIVYAIGNGLVNRGLFASEVQLLPMQVMLSTVIVAPIAEEVVFRGVFLRSLLLSHRYSDCLCLLGISLIFATLHLPSNNPAHINWLLQISNVGNAFVLGCVLGLIYMYTGQILFSILAHSMANAIGAVMPYVSYPASGVCVTIGICLLAVGVLGGVVCVKKNVAVFNNSPHL